jgi:hypothetical protein
MSALLTIKPARSGLILLACIGTPLILLSLSCGVIFALAGDLASVAYTIPIFGLGCWCLLEISTVRLHMSVDRVWLRRWWHTRWSIARHRAELRPGKVGDIPFLPGLHVIDRLTGQKIGEIISGQFQADPLNELIAALNDGTD